MKYKDYYAALGMPRDATLDDIKKACRKLARKYHPDASKDPGTEAKFKDAGDIDLADLLASMGHGRRQSQWDHGPVHGCDFDTTTHLSLEQAHAGTTVSLELDDSGTRRTLEVTVPPGVREGQKLRLRGKGGKGRSGGVDSDIYLQIALVAHPVLRADRQDLYFGLALSPWEAALGKEVEIPTLDGPMLLTVPGGTTSGRRLRIRGRDSPIDKAAAVTSTPRCISTFRHHFPRGSALCLRSSPAHRHSTPVT